MTKHRKSKRYIIIDSWLKHKGYPAKADPDDPMSVGWLLFEGSENKCKEWIMNGLFGTEGAERDHYINLLSQLASGRTKLDYQD